MVGLALIKSVYALPTWSRTVRLVAEHAALQDVLGDAPSIDATYRFTAKLRKHSSVLEACLDRVLAELREAIPDLGANVAIDGSDLPAWANGHRDLPNGKPRERYADPDASWGHRSAISTRKGGGFYGYKIEWGMLPLRVRRLPRVRLHVDLTILARLSSVLLKARAVPLAA